MSKKNANLLVNAYCDLIEAKLPITGKAQRRYLNDIRQAATNHMHNNGDRLGLEDLYDMYGTPDSVARKLAAIMSDPENPEFDVSRITCSGNNSESGNEMPRIRGCKRLTPEQAQALMQKLARGEEITPDYLNQFEDAEMPEIMNDIAKHCTCHADTDESKPDTEDALAEMAAAFEEANALADNGVDVAEIALHTKIPTTALYLGGFGNPEEDMADFIVPVRYTMQGFVKVRATSVMDAIMTASTFADDIPVPEKATLVPETMAVCEDEGMVAMFTDKFRLNKLSMPATDSGLVSPLIDRDDMLEHGDPNLIMDTILAIMGIDVECDCNGNGNCECEKHPAGRFEQADTADDEDDCDSITISIECDGKCDCCGVPESFGSCPISEKCANHDKNTTVMLHITVDCHENCDDCPIPDFLGECPILNFDDDCDCDDKCECADDICDHAEPNYDSDDCFFDDIAELPEELQPIDFDDED